MAVLVVLAGRAGAGVGEHRVLRLEVPVVARAVNWATVRIWAVDEAGVPVRLSPDAEAARVGPTVFEVSAPCAASQVVSVMAPGFLTRPVLLPDEGCGSPRSLEPVVYRARRAVVALAMDPGLKRPPFVTLEARRCRGDGEAGSVLLGRWVHPLPPPAEAHPNRMDLDLPVPAAACLDLTLYAPGAVPVGWWRVRERDGDAAPLRLDPGRLRPGLSLLALVTGDDGMPCRGCRVAVAPADRLPGLAAGALEGKIPASLPHGLTNGDGWVRVSGFEGPGPWVILATAPDRAPGFATLEEAEAGRESVAELQVGRWASLEVNLSGLDGLDVPVRVLATPEILCRKLSRAARSSSLAQGRARFPRLAPGRWEVTAMVEARKGLPEIVGTTRVELSPGENAAVELHIEGAVYRGGVRLGREPIAAELGFRPEQPSTQPPVYRARADEEGRFAVFLPGAGDYSVTVLAREQGIGTTVPGVEVRSPDRTVEVQLPEGIVSGSVVYRDGSPAAGADVVATRLVKEEGFVRRLAVETRSGEDGEFTLRAVPDGDWRVRATRGSAGSPASRVQVQDGGRVTGLRLVLEESRRIRGRVITQEGTGVAAQVQIMLSVGGGAAGPGSVAGRAQADGSFELAVPPEAMGRPASVTVLPVGGWVFVRRVVLQDDLVITAPLGGGEVVLRFPPEWFREVDVRGLVLVASDGGVIPLLNLATQGAAVVSPEGREFRIPRLGSDGWRLVHATLENAGLLLDAPGLLPSLAEFSLAPGQRAHVEVALP